GRYAKLAAADFGECRDALADLVVGGAGEAEPQAALAVGLVGRPFGAWIDRDTGGERSLVEPERVDHVGQFYPQEDAALGIVELGRRAEMLGKRFHHDFELAPQAARQLRDMVGEA